MIKSTATTRLALKKKLKDALKNNPSSEDLKDALDIVNDLDELHRITGESITIVKDIFFKNIIYIYKLPDVSLISQVNIDDVGSYELGEMIRKTL